MRNHPLVPKPFRRLYAYWLAATLIVRMPWWVLLNLTPWQRPRRSWSLRKAVTRKVLVWMFEEVGRFNMDELVYTPSYRKLESGYGGVWVEPAPSELIMGKVKEWAEQAGVKPIRIPGYWIHKQGYNIAVEQPPSKEEKVVYYLHGGAYLMFSAHPKQSLANISRGLLKHCPNVKRSFALEYRLTSISPAEPVENPFPAALLDALSGYLYLVNKVGYDPSQIVVVGDSAGGNLALALVRYLVEYQNTTAEGGPRLPNVPGALILLSPWTDMSGSHHSPESSAFTNARTDYLPPPAHPFSPDAPPAFVAPFLPGGASASVSATQEARAEFTSQNAYISPASAHLPEAETSGSFARFPRTFVAAGGLEILRDQIRALVERMRRSTERGGGEREGEGVTYFEAEDAFHDYITIPNTEPETGDTLRAIATFLGESELRTKL